MVPNNCIPLPLPFISLFLFFPSLSSSFFVPLSSLFPFFFIPFLSLVPLIIRLKNERYKRAIKIIEDTFGATHYKIGLYLNNLADTDRKRAKSDSALEKYRRALGIVEKHLGKEHSEAAEILFSIFFIFRWLKYILIKWDMGLVHHQLEDYAEAIKLFLKAYVIIEKELGPR